MIARSHLPLFAALALAACNSSDSQAKKEAAPAESAKPKSKLSQQMEAAAAASATASSPQGGPPPNGVFAPGMADETQPPAAPPKVTVVKAGDDPKVKLSAEPPAPGSKFLVVVEQQTSQGVLPTMDYTLEVAGDKDDDKDKGKGAKPAASAEPAGAGVPGKPIVFKIKKASLDEKQPGKIPDELAKLIPKLEGSRVGATVTAAGSLADVKLRVSDDGKRIAPIAATMTEALGMFFSPLPSEPVGSGASWIASDRTVLNGIPLVRYRVTTLQKLQGDDATLAVEVRLYAVSSEAVAPGVPDGLETVGLSSLGNAVYARKVASPLPLDGQLKLPMIMVLGQGGQPVQGGQLQTKLAAEAHALADKK